MYSATISRSNTRYADAGAKDLLVQKNLVQSRREIVNFLREVSSDNLWAIYLTNYLDSKRGGRAGNEALDAEALEGRIDEVIGKWLSVARPMKDRARAGAARLKYILEAKLDRTEPNKLTACLLLVAMLREQVLLMWNDLDPQLSLLEASNILSKFDKEFAEVVPMANVYYSLKMKDTERFSNRSYIQTQNSTASETSNSADQRMKIQFDRVIHALDSWEDALKAAEK